MWRRIIIGILELKGVPHERVGPVFLIVEQEVAQSTVLALVEKSFDGHGAVFLYLGFAQVEELPVNLIGKAINAIVFAIDENLDHRANGAVPVIEFSVPHGVAEFVPDVEAHSVAHPELVNAHCVENPAVVGTQSKQIGIKFLALVVNEFDGERLFRQEYRRFASMSHKAVVGVCCNAVVELSESESSRNKVKIVHIVNVNLDVD